jgi:hypothetical protein
MQTTGPSYGQSLPVKAMTMITSINAYTDTLGPGGQDIDLV